MTNLIKKLKESGFYSFILANKYLILLILIAIITHWQWFDPNSLLFHGDWRKWPDENIQRFISGGYGTYIDDLDFGVQNIQIYFSFIFFLWGIIGSYLPAVKMVMLAPIALLSLLAPYYLAKELVKDEKIAFVAALFYGFSTTLLKLELAHLFIAFVFALAPLILLFFIRLLKDCTWRNVLIFSMLFSLGCFYEVRIMYIIFYILILYFFIYITRENFIKNFFKYIILVFLILAFNAFWLLPTLFSNTAPILTIAERGLFGNNFFNIFYAFSNFEKSWSGDEFLPFITQPIPPMAWILPIFIFSVFFSYNKISQKDKKIILFSFFWALVGIVLSKQSFLPWPNLYSWLYENFPGFILFREASKFFLLIMLSYLILFAYALKYLIIENKKLNRYFKITALLVFCLLFLYQARPLMTGGVGWMFAPKIEPTEYKILNQIIKSDSNFYRTLWIPRDSHWAYYNWDKPEISLVSVKEKEYQGFYSDHDGKKNYADFIFEPFEKKYGDYLADLSSIKYFIIPMPDQQSNVYEWYGSAYQDYIDKIKNLTFLQELAIAGLDKIKIYENKDYKPYIYTFDDLFAFSVNKNLENKYDLVSNYLKKDFNFTIVNGEDKGTESLTGLENLFEQINLKDIQQNKLVFTADSATGLKDNIIYVNRLKNYLYAKNLNNIIIFYSKPPGHLSANDQKISAEPKNIIEQIYAGNNIDYYLSQDNNLSALTQGREILISQSEQAVPLVLFSAGWRNLIANPSFEQGLWQDQAKDCHNYDNNAAIGIKLNSQEKTNGNYSMQLEAARHTACASAQFSVEAGANYLFSFDYKSQEGKKVGYYISFNNPEKTVVSENYLNPNADWQSYQKGIIAPETASTATLYLYAYESDKISNNIIIYDNVQFKKLNQLKEWKLESTGKKYAREDLMLAKDKNFFIYSAADLNYQNIIKNPSFENGPWQEKVGDCHNYDANPILAMGLNNLEKSEGRSSLQLEATRHLACTSQNITVKQMATYFFSFDYQSPNAETAGYYLGFNNQQKDTLNDKLKINNRNWQNYSKIIKMPAGTTQVNLYVYAYPTNNAKNNIVRYDNFQLIEIPDLADKYYLVSEPKINIQPPGKMEYKIISPTKKEIKIMSVSAPFFLALNESFNSAWKLGLINQGNQGDINSWWPWTKPVQIAESSHYKLNNFLNAWFIDAEKLCLDNLACLKNPDGSYDLVMTAEFWPQRWFYLGAIISIMMFVSAMLFYLIFIKLLWRKK